MGKSTDLDFVATAPSLFISVIMTARLMNRVVTQDRKGEIELAAADVQNVGENAGEGGNDAQREPSLLETVAQNLSTFAIWVISQGCESRDSVLRRRCLLVISLTSRIVSSDPVVVIPIYRSPATTEWTRYFIVCGVHPMMAELILTLERLTTQGENKRAQDLVVNDPKRHYHALRNMKTAFLMEHLFVFLRRSLIGAMRDPSAIILAIVTTALEEAILRSTMVRSFEDRGCMSGTNQRLKLLLLSRYLHRCIATPLSGGSLAWQTSQMQSSCTKGESGRELTKEEAKKKSSL